MPENQNKQNIFLKSTKLALAVLISVLFLGGFNLNPTIADEDEKLPVQVRHIYDPTLFDVDSITVYLKFSVGSQGDIKKIRDVYLPEKVENFFRENLPHEKRNLPIHFGEVPDYCKGYGKWQKTRFNKPPPTGKGDLFLVVWVRKVDNLEPEGVLVKVSPCIKDLGRVRMNFPEDWSNIYPNAPVRYGDCPPFRIEWEILSTEEKINEIFCKMKADLAYLTWGLSNRRVEK